MINMAQSCHALHNSKLIYTGYSKRYIFFFSYIDFKYTILIQIKKLIDYHVFFQFSDF
jgi:hypothetical protein